MSSVNPKFLIYGSKGWIGQQLLNLFRNQKYDVYEGQCRTSDQEDVKKEIELVNPTNVICCVGRTHGTIDGIEYPTIDYLEKPGKLHENVRDNLFSPLVLALICGSKDIHLTYFGTGCIFQYDDEHPFEQETNGFVESSRPNFFGSSYSVVKGFTDELMHLMHDTGFRVLNVRIRMPITADYHPRSFITKILKYKKICSIGNSMTVLPELLPIVVDMSLWRITGTINLVNPGLISHNEILSMYKEIVDPAFEWENFTLEEQAEVLLSGRSNNYLDTRLLESRYPQVSGIKEAVRGVLMEMKEIGDM
jgi:3,5-epimerase/4-reductase